jgi:uncharacterized membrane protein
VAARTRLGAWFQTRTGSLVLAAIKLGLVVFFASLAINSGSLWQWLLALIFLFSMIGDFVNAKKAHKK